MSGSDRSPADREPPDLRLLPAAAGLWLGVAAVLVVQPHHAARVAAVAAGALAAGSAGVAVARRRGRVFPGRSVAALVAALACLVGVAVGALHLLRVSPHVVAQLVEQSAVVRVNAVVTGDPHAHRPSNPQWREATTWTAGARVTRLDVRARTYRTRLVVQLRGDAVRALAHGSTVSLIARVRPAWSPQTHAMTLQVIGEVQVRAPPPLPARVTNSIREAFRGSVAGLPPDAGALLLGLAVGDESLLPPDLDDAMIATGLSHLTAVSGTNCSLVVGLALGAVAALGLGWRTRVLACLVVLAAYVALVRPQPSVLRAAAMGTVALLALTAGGRRRGPPALFTAAVVLLVAVPELALSWGFALSVAATAGLLLVGPGAAARLGEWPVTRRLPEPVRAGLAVSTAAHLATLPLAVALGNGASWVALPANLVVAPLVPLATVVGLGAALVAPILPSAGAVLAHIGSPATAVIAWVAREGAAVPHAVLPVPEDAVGVLGATAAVLGLYLALTGRWRPWRGGRAVLAVVVLSVAGAGFAVTRDARWPPPGWVVLACDVGQGDGVLVRATGATRALLVDVGPTDGDVAGCVRDAGIEQVTVVLTHFHADHVAGLAGLLDDVAVEGLLTTPVADPPAAARQVVELAAAARVPVRTIRAGDQFQVSGIAVQVLWPARSMPGPNNASTVLVAAVPTGGTGLRVLLTGDIEPEAQVALLARGLPAVDVVKVPHHGSRYQDPALAARSRAAVALVSAGADNDYGHPDEQTLAQYRVAGAVIGRTDRQGALAVVATPAGPRLEVERR